MKKKLCLIAVALTAVFSAFMTGNTGVDYYSQKYGSLEYVYVELAISAEDVAVIEKSNESSAAGQYTLRQYYNAFVQKASAGDDLCLYKTDSQGNVTVSLVFVAAYESLSDTASDLEVKTEKGFFRNHYTVSYSNPLKTMFEKMKRYATEDESEFSESEKETWQYMLAGGIRSGGETVLAGISKIFPVLEEYDFSSMYATYNLSTPKWYDNGAPNTVSKYGETFMTWTKDNATVAYSYYVPNSVGWGITLGAAVIALVVILWFAFGMKKDKPDFADYRSMAETEVNSRVKNVLQPETSADGRPDEKGNAGKTGDGYVGSGVFVENGKTVDVFGNEATSAPEDTSAKKQNDENSADVDPFN